MVDKLETTAKAADGAGLDNLDKGDKGDRNPTLNLVDIKSDNQTKAPDATTAKAQAETMKGFPSVEIVDSHPVNDSPNKAWNRNSFSEKDTPRYEGTGNWAKLEGPTGQPDSPKEQNRKSFDVKEKPRYEGTGNW